MLPAPAGRATTEAAGALTQTMGARHMTAPTKRDTQPSKGDVALIVGGGPGISSSCVRLFARNGVSTPTLVVHNIDGRVPGIFRKGITEADPSMTFDTLRNSAFSAFLVGQQAARLMTQTAPKERSSSRTQAQRSKATHRAVPLQWHAMPSPDLRKAWRGN